MNELDLALASKLAEAKLPRIAKVTLVAQYPDAIHLCDTTLDESIKVADLPRGVPLSGKLAGLKTIPARCIREAAAMMWYDTTVAYKARFSRRYANGPYKPIPHYVFRIAHEVSVMLPPVSTGNPGVRAAILIVTKTNGDDQRARTLLAEMLGCGPELEALINGGNVR